jgi:D-beta-D-heptose 7-phosphate kinase/D-beta-D-heptose 1-phosphate adenosyltransferase
MDRTLLDCLPHLGAPRLLVLGDVMLDRTVCGDAERVSPEAPTLVLRADPAEALPGGAAAVAALLLGLGARVRLAGAHGDDDAGRTLRRLLVQAGIEHEALLCDPDRPTTVKERFLGRAGGSSQPLLRVDRETRAPLRRADEEHLAALLSLRIPDQQALLISDYAKGVCSPPLLARAMKVAARHGLPVLIDPARIPDYGRYRGASVLLPNRREAEFASGVAIDGPEDALTAGQVLCERYGVEAALVKLDGDGMALALAAGSGRHFPTQRRPVRDVTGAGDMVLAMVGLCRAAGLPWEETVPLANVAAGLEVEKQGVVPVSRAEIVAALVRGQRWDGDKRVTAPQLAALAEVYRQGGRTLVFTNGCFDLLHAGHVAFLQEAARLGDVLAVAVNTDAGVRRLKGPGRPVIGQDDRAALLGALACVDHVVLFDADTPHLLLRQVRPNVLVKGGTYAPEEVVGREVVAAYGGRVCVTGKRDGVSTTQVLAALRPGPSPCQRADGVQRSVG